VPYKIKKQKCTQSDGDKGTYVLSYTSKKGKKYNNCHTSKKKARGQIAAIEGPWENKMDTTIRSLIREILSEDVINERQTAAAKARSIVAAVEKIIGNPASGECRGSGSKHGAHCRIRIDNIKSKKLDLETLAKKSVELAFKTKASVENIGQANSGTYDTYQVTEKTGDIHNIVFTGGLTGGQRGKGYAYEETVSNNLKSAGAKSEVSAVTTGTDIFVNGIGIEVKGKSARFGEPTVIYDFSNKTFSPSPFIRSKENAQIVCDILNDSGNKQLHAWVRSIKRSWDKMYPKNKMDFLDRRIQPEDWKIMKPSLKQSGPKIPMDVTKILDYYKKKDAHYIQIQSKGLYSFDDVLGLGIASFGQAAGSMGPYIVPQIMNSGGNQVLRASISLSYTKLPNSSMNLDNPEDAQKFADALNKK